MQNNLSHIALILDGNNRWSKLNNINVSEGYKKGFENIRILVDHCLSINIEYLTVFALSSENFNRPNINIIYDLIYHNFDNLLNELINKKDVQIKIFGSRINLPSKIIKIFNKSEENSKKNKKLKLNIAFNYGFKNELIEIFKTILQNKSSNKIIDIKTLNSFFVLGNYPDPDILIRTGGYKRLSNFMMYNLTYTELFFTNTLWPEFKMNELDSIIDKYKKINRKYGL